jgi:hypothetical protein
VDNYLCEIAYMQEPGENPLYARLMAIKPEGLSLNAWTLKAGVSRVFFNDVRKRGNARHDSLVKILDAAGVSLAQFETGGTVRTEVRRSPVADFRPAEGARRDLPLLGTALGGEMPDLEGLDEDSADLIELDLGEVIDHLERPAAIANDRDAYALTILGDSMAPRFEPGERILVSPRAPSASATMSSCSCAGARAMTSASSWCWSRSWSAARRRSSSCASSIPTRPSACPPSASRATQVTVSGSTRWWERSSAPDPGHAGSSAMDLLVGLGLLLGAIADHPEVGHAALGPFLDAILQRLVERSSDRAARGDELAHPPTACLKQ